MPTINQRLAEMINDLGHMKDIVDESEISTLLFELLSSARTHLIEARIVWNNLPPTPIKETTEEVIQ